MIAHLPCHKPSQSPQFSERETVSLRKCDAGPCQDEVQEIPLLCTQESTWPVPSQLHRRHLTFSLQEPCPDDIENEFCSKLILCEIVLLGMRDWNDEK